MKKYDVGILVVLAACLTMACIALYSTRAIRNTDQYKRVADQYPRLAESQNTIYKTNQSYNQNIFLSKDGANGENHLTPDQCYQYEAIADCAARVVQGKVFNLYVWLLFIGIGETLIGVFTALILMLQTKIMGRQHDHFALIDRPYVAEVITNDPEHLLALIGRKAKAEAVGPYAPLYEIWVKNYGKTPAILKHVWINVYFSADPTPKDTVAKYLPLKMPAERVLEAGTSTHRLVADFAGVIASRTFDLDSDICSLIRQGRIHLWYEGFVEYRDFFGQEYEHRFSWRHCFTTGVFETNPEYKNYTKTKTKK